MKRTIGSLIALVWFGAALAVPVSSQTASAPAKLSMWNRGVFNFDLSAGTTSVGPSWMGGGGGVYNSLSLDWSWKDVSWTMTGQWDGDNWNNLVNLRDYSGSYRLFSGFARITAGKVRSDGGFRFANFDTTGFSARLAEGEPGLLLCLYPAQGFSFGAFLPIPVGTQALGATFGDANFGVALTLDKLLALKASYRMEADSGGNRELAAGVQLLALRDFILTIGYRYLDAAVEHDIFLDTSLRVAALTLKAFADANFKSTGFYYGGKINLEYEFAGTPFIVGTSASYGNGDAWYDSDLDAEAYLRYGFLGGSSVQAGGNVAYDGTSPVFGARVQYTISF